MYISTYMSYVCSYSIYNIDYVVIQSPPWRCGVVYIVVVLSQPATEETGATGREIELRQVGNLEIVELRLVGRLKV
jgi:hypothetical protein